MLNKITAILMLFFCNNLKAQYPDFKLSTDTIEFSKQFIQEANRIKSIKSEFVQEKNLNILSEKISSKGIFWFKRESMVRIEYQKPFQYLLVINKNSVMMKDGDKTTTMSLKSNNSFQQISRIMLDCMQGSIYSNPDFKTKLFENKSLYMLEMTPLAKGLSNFFKVITISIDKTNYSVISINMIEVSGDNTLINFKNREINIEVPDALFDIHK